MCPALGSRSGRLRAPSKEIKRRRASLWLIPRLCSPDMSHRPRLRVERHVFAVWFWSFENVLHRPTAEEKLSVILQGVDSLSCHGQSLTIVLRLPLGGLVEYFMWLGPGVVQVATAHSRQSLAHRVCLELLRRSIPLAISSGAHCRRALRVVQLGNRH